MTMKFPITVEDIKFDNTQKIYNSNGWRSKDIGKFVAIRSVNDEDGDKTYLGLYIGEVSISLGTSYNRDKKELTVYHFMQNPAIYVFDLKKVLFGCESWWGIIETEKDLQQITDKDIENVWYVKALKQLTEKETDAKS